MPYVITEPCVGTKDKSCVDICPVDCIHGTDSDLQLYIAAPAFPAHSPHSLATPSSPRRIQERRSAS